MSKGMIKMKKVVIELIRSITDGGAETLLKDYALLLNKNLIDVKVVTLFYQPNSANYKILLKNNVKVYSLYNKWNFVTKGFNKVFGKIYVPYRLKKILDTENAEVIHAHMTVLKYLKPISKELFNCKLFYTCHSLPERYFSGMHKEEYECGKYLIKNNNLRLIGLHKDMADELNNMFNVKNTAVINNGIDFNRFKGIDTEKKEIRKKLGIPENAFVLGHVGRFHPVKNHKFIVQVFEKLKEKKKNSFLLLVGDGDETNNIKKMLDERKLQNDYLILSNRTDIPEILKTMDVFIFPSIAEGLGIALVEAQVSGLRCIVSKNVPEAAYLTNLVIPLGLEDSINSWVNAIVDDNMYGTYSGDLDSYDMNKEIKKLEQMYIN